MKENQMNIFQNIFPFDKVLKYLSMEINQAAQKYYVLLSK